MAPNRSVKPVDPVSLRGLSSHAESHWLTFATAMRCYAQQPTQPSLAAAADRHGPNWLRSALRKDTATPRTRPREFEPETGSLAFLTEGAEAAMKPPAEPEAIPAPRSDPKPEFPRRTDEMRLPPVRGEKTPDAEWASSSLEAGNRERMERFLTMAAARADITRRL